MPGTLLTAFHNLMKYTKTRNAINIIKRLSPQYRRDVAYNTAVIRNVLEPKILERLNSADDIASQQTIVDFALRHVKASNAHPSAEFMDILIATIKAVLFAAHDTTAQTM